MKRLFPIAAALFVAVLAACDAGTASAPEQANATLAPTFRFLESIVDAPMKVAYSGKRRVVFDYLVDGQNQHLDYTEQVYSDGGGKYLIDSVTVIAPAMTDEQRDVFVMMQRARDSFSYLHRDFRIRDLALFEQNYALTVLPRRTTVAGRTCVVMDVRNQSAGTNRYRIEVDPETGLVMRWRETATDGAIVATVEFQSFTLNPDLTHVSLHGTQFAVEPLVPATIPAQMGFPVLLPRLLPHGYQLTRAERISEQSGPWARVTYGDGVEQIFYLYADVSPSVVPHTAATPDPLFGAPVVWVYQIGPWTAVQGQFGNKRCSAVGKVSESALLDMIQSAIE